MKKSQSILVTIIIVLVVIILAGMYRFNYLSNQNGYDVDGNKIIQKNIELIGNTEVKQIKETKEVKDKKIKLEEQIQEFKYTTNTKAHTGSVGEDIFVYNNGAEILTIKSRDRATYLYKLIDNKLFINEGTSAGNRTMIVYNLDKPNIITEIKYYGQIKTDEDNNTIIYSTMTYDKPEKSEITCGEQEGYFQKHSFDFQKLESKNIGKIYCQYVE